MKEYNAASVQIVSLFTETILKEYNTIALVLTESVVIPESQGEKTLVLSTREPVPDAAKRTAKVVGETLSNHSTEIGTIVGAAVVVLAAKAMGQKVRLPRNNAVSRTANSIKRDFDSRNKASAPKPKQLRTITLDHIKRIELKDGHKEVIIDTSVYRYHITFGLDGGKKFYDELAAELNW